MRKRASRALSALLAAVLMISNTSSVSASGGLDGVVINEVCPSNRKLLEDSDGDSSDWIELYNSGSKTVSLGGAYLSDDPDQPDKWRLPDVRLKPKEYLIVFCSDKDRTSGELHTSFKLSAGDESIILSGSDKKPVDSIAIPNMYEDTTYGRYPDGGSSLRILSGTPGSSNSGSKSVTVAAPIFSAASGFYDSEFKLGITADAGLTIYYTTDGSVPTTRSKKFSGSVPITSRAGERAVLMFTKGMTVNESSEYIPSGSFPLATVIRAIAVDSKGNKSPVTTATYFVGKDICQKYDDISVISVVTDPDNLFDQETGIYTAGNVFKEWRAKNPSGTLDGSTPANFNQRGSDWEKEAHVDFFDKNELGFSVECGVRVQGGWSRNSQQKSLKFYMRSEYGDSKLSYTLFEDNYSYDDGELITDYKRFMIRSGGNDEFMLKFKCAWTQSLVDDLEFCTQNDRIVVCFLDGEYWGVYTLNNVYDDNYISDNYGVPKDEVIMIKAGELQEGKEGDDAAFYSDKSFVENNDMSVAANYQKACELFDMDSLMDYMAVEMYIGNQDWIGGNWAVWSTRTADGSAGEYHDSRWRFMLYDTEFSMDLYNAGRDYKYDVLEQLVIKGDGFFSKMLTSLLKNKEFKADFIVAMEKVANVCFNPGYAKERLQDYSDLYTPYLEEHFDRFIGWRSVSDIRNNVSSWKAWLDNRLRYLPEMLKKDLKLSSSKTVTLTLSVSSLEGGTISFDDTDIRFTSTKWTGQLLPGYSVILEAKPAPGYRFVGWSGSYSGTASKISLNPSRAYSLKANFEKIG